jgi:large subunit ribosomal protein L6
MSRIGKHPIVIPAGVTVEVKDGYSKRKNGQLYRSFRT